MSQTPENALRTAYTGEVATRYNLRVLEPHWQIEQDTVHKFLREIALPAGTPLLDVPVGTGRFLPFYSSLGFSVSGADVSPDMLRQAEQYRVELGGTEFRALIADVAQLPFPAGAFPVVVCIRLMHHVSFVTFAKYLAELRRVTSEYLILSVTVQREKVRLAPILRVLMHAPGDVFQRAARRICRAVVANVSRDGSRRDAKSEGTAMDWGRQPRQDTRKHERDVVAEFSRVGFRIVRAATITTGLHPLQQLEGKIFLLQKGEENSEQQ